MKFTTLAIQSPKRRAGLVLVLTLLAGCGILPPSEEMSLDEPMPDAMISAPSSILVPEPVILAMGMLDVPYRRGGNTPKGFDCSGLVYYVYRQLGVQVGRSAQEQFRQAQPVTADNLRPGDLVFYRLRTKAVSHVGIYAGEGRFIHAPSHGKRVSYALMAEPYWQKRFAGAGRYSSAVAFNHMLRQWQPL
ncbi:MAG: C40 family peptidase [Gammaproteobacteria bacterium]|nr:C40 family peptidase [Gammaproteobacteria bacterium]